MFLKTIPWILKVGRRIRTPMFLKTIPWKQVISRLEAELRDPTILQQPIKDYSVIFLMHYNEDFEK